MNIHFIGSTYFFIVIVILFTSHILSFLISLIMISLTIILFRLIITKKRKKLPNNDLLKKIISLNPIKQINLLMTKVHQRSFISAHTARISAIFVILGSINALFYLGLILSLLIGFLRIKEGYHDVTDVGLGFLLGIYTSLTALYLESLIFF